MGRKKYWLYGAVLGGIFGFPVTALYFLPELAPQHFSLKPLGYLFDKVPFLFYGLAYSWALGFGGTVSPFMAILLGLFLNIFPWIVVGWGIGLIAGKWRK